MRGRYLPSLVPGFKPDENAICPGQSWPEYPNLPNSRKVVAVKGLFYNGDWSQIEAMFYIGDWS